MDLRIDAKRFCAVTMTKNNAPNQMTPYPTPPPSIVSIPRTPDSTSSRYSLDEKVHRQHPSATRNNTSEGKPITAASPSPVKQYSNVSPIALAEILRKTPVQHRRDTKPSTMILKKIQQLKRARDAGMQESPPRQTLVYRTMANYSRIDENAFIRIDEQGFHEKKRLRVQTEDDLLKDENILKKFKPNDFHRLPKTLKSREHINLMALLLKSTLCNDDSLPQNESLAWLGYIACMQRANNGNDRNRRRPRKVRKSRPGKNQITDRFKLTIKTLSRMDVQLLAFKDKGATTDISVYSQDPTACTETPEEPETVETPKLPKDQSLPENNGQDSVPQKHKLALKDIAAAKPQPVENGSSGSAVPENNHKLTNGQRSKILQEINGQYPVPQKQNLALNDIPLARPRPVANEVSGSAVPKLQRSNILQENNTQYPVPQKPNLAPNDIPSAKPQPVANESLRSAVLKKELKNSLKSEPSQIVNMIGREVAIKYPYPCEHNPDLYVIGPNGSTISKASWENINWGQTPAAITRKILMCLFDKYTLATHSLSGRPSPAFKGIYKAEKMPLHAGKVADTVSIVTSHVNVTPKEVRMAITTKCADECKMLRLRQEKKSKINKEFLEKLGAQQV